jgi:Domain of unknown function (DUF1707)/Cell wall-active antibiotics response 4TMS YvqF
MTPAEDPNAQPASPSDGRPPARQPAPADPVQQRREVLRSGQSEPTPNILPAVRASDSDRNAVAERLRDAFADGRLDEEEFDVRMQRALTARTRQDLDILLQDLGRTAASGAPIPAPPAAPAGAAEPFRRNTAILSTVSRKGRWMVPQELSAVAVLGDVKLDLRAAALSSPVTTIRVQAILGDVTLVVPPGVRVEVNGSPVMGEIRDRVDDAHLGPGAPLVRVDAFVLLGQFTARTKAPGTRKWWHALFGD